MSDTYKHLSKAQKYAVDMFDVETFDYCLKHALYAELVHIYDIISQCYTEGMILNEFHQAVLLYPMKLWGRRSGQVMFEMKKQMWEKQKAERDAPKLSKEQAAAQRQAKRFDSFAHLA